MHCHGELVEVLSDPDEAKVVGRTRERLDSVPHVEVVVAQEHRDGHG
jgi:hypothetical protein